MDDIDKKHEPWQPHNRLVEGNANGHFHQQWRCEGHSGGRVASPACGGWHCCGARRSTHILLSPPTCPHRAFAVTNCARSASCTAMYCGSHTPLERHAMASASQGARDPASAPAPKPSLNRGVHTSTSDRAHCSPATTAGPAQWGTARRVQAPPPPPQLLGWCPPGTCSCWAAAATRCGLIMLFGGGGAFS